MGHIRPGEVVASALRAAYAELLGWYLGDGHISLGGRRVHSLHVFNDPAASTSAG